MVVVIVAVKSINLYINLVTIHICHFACLQKMKEFMYHLYYQLSIDLPSAEKVDIMKKSLEDTLTLITDYGSKLVNNCRWMNEKACLFNFKLFVVVILSCKLTVIIQITLFNNVLHKCANVMHGL